LPIGFDASKHFLRQRQKSNFANTACKSFDGTFFFYVAQTLRPHQPNDDFSFLRGAPSTTTSQGNHLSGIYPSQGTAFLQRAAAKMRN
jgi:hypothetical protein